ncbi:MAG: protein kinase [Pyrinomonadaceae bacterium]|nr:protein kinase [Pyrinomonadaceae bacterium]
MDPTRWKLIDDLVDAALDLPDADRAAFVAEQSGDDNDLRNEVLRLLAAQRPSENFLNESAMGAAAAAALAEERATESEYRFLDKTIANYKVEELIGAGGMGEVYLARDERLHRRVALKILPPEFISNDERVKRFEQEARAISQLNHPNIVTVYDVGNYEGVNYIATEFVEGKTLRELIGRDFKLRNILLNSIQICDALSAAHNAGIIHRDIKPENIMIRRDGYAKILDFGLAKLTDAVDGPKIDMAKTSKGMLIGTPGYMSPEQISGDPVDHRTDLWSAGVVLYEFLTGTNPFKKGSRQATLQAIVTETPPLPSELNSEIPEELDRILLKALEKDPDVSYQSAADLRADLKRVLREIDSSPSWSGSSSSRLQVAGRYRDWSFLAAVIMAAFFVSFGIFYLFFNEARPNAAKWSAANSVQLTFAAGTEAYPSLSPDGRSLLYVTDLGAGDDIYLLRIGGSNAINLTADSPARDTMPAYSPDGNMIAFRSDREPAGIYIMGATGENPRRVSDFGFSPSWSPDGRSIVVATGHQPIPSVRTRSALWIVDIETGEKRMLIDSFALQPAWSPRGDRIAYWMSGDSGERVVETIPASGGTPVLFTDAGNTNWNPVWSTDGSYLYFSSDRRGDMAIWRSRIDIESGQPTGEPELVPTAARFNRHLSFAADGRRMAYVNTNVRANIRIVDFDAKSEKTVGNVEAVTRGDFEFTNVEMSPDGQRFFARLIRKNQEDIVSLKADGTDLRSLTNDSHFDRYPRLSPDGTKILFVSDRSGTYQVWLMNSDGTNLRQLTPSEAGVASIPVWAPDSRRFVFDNEQTSFIGDIEQPIDLTQIAPLPRTENGGWFRTRAWSPDGKLLAGNFDSAYGPGTGIYSFESQTYTRLTENPAVPRWFPDSKRIIFLRGRRPMIANVVTKEVREAIPEIRDEMRSIGLSRDGTKLYYTTFENESDIYLLDIASK